MSRRYAPRRRAPARPASRRRSPASPSPSSRRRRARRGSPARASRTGGTARCRAAVAARRSGTRRRRGSAKSAVLPPIAGPDRVGRQQVADERCRARRTGSAPTSISAVIASQRPAERRTPSDVPGRVEQHDRRRAPSAYAVSTLARKYARTESGVSRSWRFQPTRARARCARRSRARRSSCRTRRGRP